MDININDIIVNKFGEEFTIIRKVKLKDKEKINMTYYLIKFTETGNLQIAPSSSIGRLITRDNSKPIFYGIGYIKSNDGEPIIPRGDAFDTWHNMIYRCYSGKIKQYRDVEVCTEWHNFANFAEWYKNHSENIEHTHRKLCLDKDLFAQGNKKIYSPQTCCFLPNELNAFVNALKIKDRKIPANIPGRTVYILSKLVDKFKPVLDENVTNLLQGYVDDYITKFNKENRVSFKKMFREAIETKIDISNFKINALAEYRGKLFKFETIGEMKKFIERLEKEAILNS